MRRTPIYLATALGLIFVSSTLVNGELGRGRAAVGGRGAAVGGAFGGAAGSVSRAGAVVGPAGGSVRAGGTAGAVSGPRGGSIDYGGARVGASGPLGGAAGGAVGGVKVTTPGGATVGKAGAVGGAVGPGGRGTIDRVGAAGAIGPGGNALGSAYRGGVAFGPAGAVAGGTRVGGVAAAGRVGTYRVSGTALRTQGTVVRNSFTNYNCFNTNWYRGHPGAWFTAGWAAGRAWSVATWPFLTTYCALPATPVYYDYGSTVVYQDNRVYIDGQDVASADNYTAQTMQIADAGRQAKPAEKDDWQPLGVFGLVQGDEKTAYKIFQLAVNKDGIIRGNYYDALADSSLPIYGSVDKSRQLAAWSIGENKNVVYEAGIANLTLDEATVLVHFGADDTQQFSLVRIPQKEGT